MPKMTQNHKELVEANLFLVRNIIVSSIYMRKDIPELSYNDLYQTGCEALCYAAIAYRQDKGASFPTYASIVIRHSLLTHCRKALKVHADTVPLDTKISTAEDLTLADMLPDTGYHALEDLETLILLNNYEDSLPEHPKKRVQVLRDYYFGAYNITELSKIYHISPNMVSSWIHRAKKKMRMDYFLSA